METPGLGSAGLLPKPRQEQSSTTMKRILVIGSGGSGKSTLAVRLGRLLKIEVVHLDSIYWHPGWVETPKVEWKRTVEKLVEHPEWVIDGNYSGTLETRLEACDTVVFLDFPRLKCLWRVIKRMALFRNSIRPDMARGCPERLDLRFLLWVWTYSTRSRPKIVRLLQHNSNHKQIFWLRSDAEMEAFLARLGEDTV
jgi:adenylate kinase family enzyme